MGSIGYRPDIQGLRAIAVLSVIVFHFNSSWLPGGFVGVDIFLVISGFLIFNILLNEISRSDCDFAQVFKRFYLSRFKRIVPAYFVMLVIVSWVAAVFFLPQDMGDYRKSLSRAAYFNSNNYFSEFGDYFSSAIYEQPLLHTWSLAVEVQFYILVPLLVLFFSARSLKWLLVAFLVFFTAVAEYRLRILGVEQETYYSLYSRLPEFFAGGLVALYVNFKARGSKWFGSAGLLLICFALVFMPFLGPFPGILALLPALAVSLVLLFPLEGAVKLVLVNPLMEWVGKLSYSLYLWHWPILAILRYYTGDEVLDLSFSLIFLILTLLMSIASYWLVEKSFRESSSGSNHIYAYGALFIVALVVGKNVKHLNELFSPELGVEYKRYADQAVICHGSMTGDCAVGDLKSNNQVLVIGDSHAAMLNVFFDYLGEELSFKAKVVSASSCVPILNFDYKRIDEFSRYDCRSQIESVKNLVRESSVIFLAAKWSWHLESSSFEYALSSFLQKQSQMGKKIYLIAQVPLLSQNPLRALRFKELGLPYGIEVDTSYQLGNEELRFYAEKYAGIYFLKFENSGFFSKVPFYKGDLIYLDKDHLNQVGAENYARVVLPYFKQALHR
ncbi:MAG: acyltransferase family protein [Pseudomonas sp.]|uniref:acyltransferase family protein n=1 Tax=Pseudomonas sp. TaxID=306 RepID=UPI00271DA1C0|nr:acyltransferase family protein [Pseudomonas sp.]MDO9616051.1 acyltransferase family protein [Pseudomonas sp.]MDP2446222.1 acyltransferase family protein [Pseudomonas sp.]